MFVNPTKRYRWLHTKCDPLCICVCVFCYFFWCFLKYVFFFPAFDFPSSIIIILMVWCQMLHLCTLHLFFSNEICFPLFAKSHRCNDMHWYFHSIFLGIESICIWCGLLPMVNSIESMSIRLENTRKCLYLVWICRKCIWIRMYYIAFHSRYCDLRTMKEKQEN